MNIREKFSINRTILSYPTKSYLLQTIGRNNPKGFVLIKQQG